MNINYLNNVLNVAINENEENKIPLIKHSPCVNTDEKLGRAISQIYHFLDSRAYPYFTRCNFQLTCWLGNLSPGTL